MNIIHLLKDHVVSKVFTETPPSEKEGRVIEDFLGIFTASAAAKKDFTEVSSARSSEEILEKLFPNEEAKNKALEKLSEHHDLEQSKVNELVDNVTPAAVTGLQKLADGKAVPDFIRDNFSDVTAKLPKWAAAILPAAALGALGLGGDKAAATTKPTESAKANPDNNQRAINSNPPKSESKKFWPWILGLLILALLGWFFFGGNKSDKEATPGQADSTQTADQNANADNQADGTNNPATTAEDDAPVQEEKTADVDREADASLQLAGAEGDNANKPDSLEFAVFTDEQNKVVKCEGRVGSDNLKQELSDAFPEANCDISVDSENVKTEASQSKLAEVLMLVSKTPNASLEINEGGAKIVVPNQEAANKFRKETLDALPGYSFQVDVENNGDINADDSDADSANSHVDLKDDGTVQFFFATGESTVAKGSEDKIADIVAAAKEGKTIGITGYTDSTGNAAINAKLSKKRASSVKAFLILNGVPEDKIELIKPDETVAASGNDREGRRVDVYLK